MKKYIVKKPNTFGPPQISTDDPKPSYKCLDLNLNSLDEEFTIDVDGETVYINTACEESIPAFRMRKWYFDILVENKTFVEA